MDTDEVTIKFQLRDMKYLSKSKDTSAVVPPELFQQTEQKQNGTI